MPRWEETVLGSRSRYEQVIQALADKYAKENLLLVSHGKVIIFFFNSFIFMSQNFWCRMARKSLNKRIDCSKDYNLLM